MNFIKEMLPGQLIDSLVKSGVSQVGSKSLSTSHRMYDADSGVLHASCESVCVCFDDIERKSTAIPDDVRIELLDRVVDADS